MALHTWALVSAIALGSGTAGSSSAAGPPAWVDRRRVAIPTQNWGQPGAVRPKGEWIGAVNFETNNASASLKYMADHALPEGTFGYMGVSAVVESMMYSFPVGASSNYPFRSTTMAIINLTSGQGTTATIPGLIELGHIQGARYDQKRKVIVLWGLTLPGEDHKNRPGDYRNLIADLDIATRSWSLWPGDSGNFSGGECASEIGQLDYDPESETFYSGCSVITGFNYVVGVKRGVGVMLKTGPIGAQYDLLRGICAPSGGTGLLAVVHSFIPPSTDGPDTVRTPNMDGNFTSLYQLKDRFLTASCDYRPPEFGTGIVYVGFSNATGTSAGAPTFALHYTSVTDRVVDAQPVPLDLGLMQVRGVVLYEPQ